MVTDVDLEIAKPARGTVRTIAECRHCETMIEKSTVDNKTWYHSSTGEIECQSYSPVGGQS